MSARDDIHRLFESGRTSYRLDEYLNAHRAEVLREAEGKAREIVAKLWVDGTTRKRMNRADGARAVEWEIGLMASGNDEPAAAPDFFQPGHTYEYAPLHLAFRCDAVNAHPETGGPSAIGWIRYSDGRWRAGDYSPEHYDEAGWTEVAPARQEPESQHYDKVPDPLDGCHWCACGNRWPCEHAKAVTA